MAYAWARNIASRTRTATTQVQTSRVTRYAARYTIIAALSAGTYGFCKDHLLDHTSISGRSMNPTLSPEVHETGRRDRVLWQTWQPSENLRAGDVVMFYSPFHPESRAVKRVIATGGDTVYLDPKRRPGYGKAHNELQPEVLVALERWNTYDGSLIVPFGHLWVEGDNWRESLDSNTYGPISKSLVVGKALCTLWPPSILLAKPWTGYQSTTRVVHDEEVLSAFWLE